MYNIHRQGPNPVLQMAELYSHMMNWLDLSKTSYEAGDFEKYHKLVNKIIDTNSQMISLFEPARVTEKPAKDVCYTMQALAEDNLKKILAYSVKPSKNYEPLQKALAETHKLWQEAAV